jgi:hypothetical protein
MSATATTVAVVERRCWRCLRMFPGDATRAPTKTPEWWLCQPCERVLLPSRKESE